MRTRRAIGAGSITSAIKPRGVRCLAASSALCRIVLGLVPRIISDLAPQIIVIAPGHAHMVHRVVPRIRALARSSSLLPGLLHADSRS
jgi:hypothetical protein